MTLKTYPPMTPWIKTLTCSALLATATLTPTFAQEATYTPTPENLQARQEFADNRFGIFLHWGIYSMFAQGEWYMHNANIHHDE